MSTGAKPIELEHVQGAQSSSNSRVWLQSAQSGLWQETSPEQIPGEEWPGHYPMHIAADPRLLIRQVKWFVKHNCFHYSFSLSLSPF